MRGPVGLLCWMLIHAAMAQPAIPVTVQPLDELLIDREMRAVASVVPANRSGLAAEVGALVATVNADVGHTVDAGELLIQLEDRDYRLALQRAEAMLAALDARITQAELRLDRAAELSRSRHISEDDLLARETELAVLQAERRAQAIAVDEARNNLQKTHIRAPFAGEVIARAAQVGAYVAPGTLLVTVVQTTGREVEAEIDSGHSESLLEAGGGMFVSRGQRWPVVLDRLGSVIDPAQRIQTARLRFADRPAPVGASGELVWTGARRQVPADLIVRRDGAYGLFLVTDGRARFVVLPQAQEGRPAVAELAGDVRVIVGGRDRVRDGDPVRVDSPLAD